MFGWTANEALGRKVYEVIPTEYSDVEMAQTLRQLSEMGGFRGDMIMYHKDGTPVYTEARTIALRGEQEEEGEITGYLNITRDITERKLAEQELATRTHQQGIVAEFGLRALSNNDLQTLLNEAVDLVARTLEVEYVKVVVPLSSGEEMLVRAGVGWREGLVGRAREPAGLDSEAGYAMEVEEPLIVEDLSTETRFEPSELIREHGIVSGISVVIHGQEEPLEVLSAYTTSRRIFTEDDANFLQAVTNVLATAIQHKEAEDRLEEVREVERSRIARDLHDDALQDLANALVKVQLVQSISRDPEVSRQLGQLLAVLDRMGPHLRGAIYDLRLEAEQERPFSELLEP
jgi:PAS domain S-box-containing protein